MFIFIQCFCFKFLCTTHAPSKDFVMLIVSSENSKHMTGNVLHKKANSFSILISDEFIISF